MTHAIGHIKAHDVWESMFGDYALEPNLINGRSHWTKLDGKQTIWYNELDDWVFTSIALRGSKAASATLFSSFDTACAHDVGSPWKYYEYENDIWEIKDAGKGAIVECVQDLKVTTPGPEFDYYDDEEFGNTTRRCTKDNPCGEGEGDCNLDEDCIGTLRCGTDNCSGLEYENTDDCCQSK